jgi:hypothetical protein
MDSTPLTRTEKKKQGKRISPYSSKHVRTVEQLRIKGEATKANKDKTEVK